MPKGSPRPWSYYLIRLLFKFVLKIFYGTIVVEGIENIPVTGQPCVVCANHTNSLTDALLLVTAIPSRKRNMLRLTAKSTQFGKRTFTSWLIESAGTIPIKRRKDFADGTADNTEVMAKLIEALEHGDAVCMFPEGASRYHPTIAPLKTGVARIVSDVLSRNRDNPEFEMSVLTCSITYMNRQRFRSDVLVTFHPPLKFTPKISPELLSPVDYTHIRTLTSDLHAQIASGTFDAPSWELIRMARLAAPIYAPLGTSMGLGDYVRVVRTFLEAFKAEGAGTTSTSPVRTTGEVNGNGNENERTSDTQGEEANGSTSRSPADEAQDEEDWTKLKEDLKNYLSDLYRLKIKDDRIRRPLPRPVIFYRMIIRLTWAIFLLSISIPGLILWTPVGATTYYAVHNFKKTGPSWDVWDEVAQYKLVYGLLSGLAVWFLTTLLTLPLAPITFFTTPLLMWITLRWFEDAVSSFRAFATLSRLLWVGKSTLARLRERRRDLYVRIMDLAVNELGLPADPEAVFVDGDGDGEGGEGSDEGEDERKGQETVFLGSEEAKEGLE